jgi:hypothetical protein
MRWFICARNTMAYRHGVYAGTPLVLLFAKEKVDYFNAVCSGGSGCQTGNETRPNTRVSFSA